ncbi:MAG: hypothetical protein F6K17_00710 [Okeania sp. SIO3C4]|nr:hypothetical protein [Okeania sp. SIO3C4]
MDTTGVLYQKQPCLGTQVIFGGKLRRRKFDNQATELFIQCAILNRMIQNCKPESYKVKFAPNFSHKRSCDRNIHATKPLLIINC